MRVSLFAVLLFLLVSPLAAQLPSQPPMVEGYVTRASGIGDFDVDGIHVIIGPQIHLTQRDGNAYTPLDHLNPVYLGQFMRVWGRTNLKSHSVKATAVEQATATVASLAGQALIDYIPATSPDGVRSVRADGYLLSFSKDSKVSFTAPLTGIDQLATNLWIRYRGVQQTDGVVIVTAAEIWPNVISESEGKLRTKREFDPASVDEEDAQSGLSKAFLGLDARRLPAHLDEPLQARIERIGQSLIPVYQKALPLTDPTRIHFRFQVVEAKHLRDAIAFANGIILVPYPAITRLQNDSQIAALLADNIAASLEKQEVLAQPAEHHMAVANIAGDVVGLVVPGVSLATGITTYGMEKHIATLHRRQSGRVALCFMHDGGYDLAQAPLAWWLLDPAKPKPLEQINFPDRAAYLYSVLGNTWRAEALKIPLTAASQSPSQE